MDMDPFTIKYPGKQTMSVLTLESGPLSMHDAMMGNMLVYHGRRGGRTSFGFVGQEGRRKEDWQGRGSWARYAGIS